MRSRLKNSTVAGIYLKLPEFLKIKKNLKINYESLPLASFSVVF